MKRVIFTLFLSCASVFAFSQTTYYWVGGTTEGNVSVAANWNTQINGSGTTRTAAATDILVIDGTNIGGSTPTTGTAIIAINSATTAQLKVINGANVIFDRASSTGTLTIANNTPGQDGLFIDATSNLTLTTQGAAVGAVYIDLPAGATGSIAGKIKLAQGAATTASNRLTSRTVGGVTFLSGSTFEFDNTLGYPFGTVSSSTPGTSNSLNYAVIFQSGANLINNSIYSPFGSASTSTIVDFKPGSNYYIKNTMTTGSFTNAKTFGNIFIQNNATLTTDAAALNKIENLTIDAGCSWVVGTSSSSLIPILGNLVVNGTLNGTSGGGGTTSLVMAGNAPQTISGSGSIAVSNFIVADNASVTLNKNITVALAANIYGKINFGTFQLSGAGTFTSRVNTVPSTGATQTGASLTTGSFLVNVATGLGLSGLPGLAISGTGIPAGTNIASYSSSGGVITLSQAATVTDANTTLTFSNNAAQLETNNTNGFDSTTGSVVLVGTKSYRSGTNYIINASTTAPIGISSGSTSTTANNFILNASATTNYDLTVTGTLTLNNGKLTIRSTDSVKINSGNAIGGSGFGSTKYIVTEKSGANVGVLAISNFSTARTLPIGSASNYLPVTLTPTTADAFATSVFEGITTDGTANGTAMTAAQKAKVVDAVWTINRMSSNTDNCTVALNWPASLEGSSFGGYANNIGVARYSGTWGVVGGSGNNTTNTATHTFDAFSPFGVGQLGFPLPVKLSNISAIEQQGKVKVTWNVDAEIDVDAYSIEKSTNGSSFSAIATVAANGSKQYVSIDNTPASINYYRIKVTNKNGSIEYSNVVTVKLNSKDAAIAVFPNPVKGNKVSLQLSNLEKGTAEIKLFNNLGQQLMVTTINYEGGSQLQSIALPSNIGKGMYRLVVTNAGKNLQQTIMVD